MIKIGSFRILTKEKETYMRYSELYDMDPEFIARLKSENENGGAKLYCACRDDNALELHITSKNVIRVANNLLQEQHAQSCPKSELYPRYLKENEDGILQPKENANTLVFDITIPTGIKAERNGNGSSSSSNSEKKKRAEVVFLAMKVNCFSWLKQNYSIRKHIRVARAKNEPYQWQYKSLDDFVRLFFGVTNDIILNYRKDTFSLSEICYKRNMFLKADYKKKFFLYAKIIKVSPYKEDRKYQYITVNTSSEQKPIRTPIRILTEDFDEIKNKVKDYEKRNIFLAAYVRHDRYSSEEETTDWITAIKAGVFEVATNGLYVRHHNEVALYDMMCKAHILFYRPIYPVENYGFEIPTAIIPQYGSKDILIDLCKSDAEMETRSKFAKNNPEFAVCIFKKDTKPKEIIDRIFAMFKEST